MILTNVTEFLIIPLIWAIFILVKVQKQTGKKIFPEYYYRALWELRYLIKCLEVTVVHYAYTGHGLI